MRALLALTLLTATATAQWQLQQSHTTASLRGIHALGGGVAWASGTEGTVLRTTDDGVTWQACAIPPNAEHLDFRGIQAFDAKTAIVMSSGKGDLSRLYKTTDACQTWKLVFTHPDKEGFFDTISFDLPYKDAQGQIHARGNVFGDPLMGTFTLFHSDDDGDSWSRKVSHKREPGGAGCKVDAFVAKDREAAFAASNQSLVSYSSNVIFVTGGAVSRLGYTDHFDLDFALCHDSARFINLPITHGNPSSGAFALATTDRQYFFPLRLMIVGGDYLHPEQSQGTSVFLSSRDGFHLPFTGDFDVISPQIPPHGYRSAVAYSPTQKAWITVGPNGTDLSTDDGRTWRPLHPTTAPNADPEEDQHWNALSLPFVVGPKGRIGKLREDAIPTKSRNERAYDYRIQPISPPKHPIRPVLSWKGAR